MTYYLIKSTVCNFVPISCEAKCEKEKKKGHEPIMNQVIRNIVAGNDDSAIF